MERRGIVGVGETDTNGNGRRMSNRSSGIFTADMDQSFMQSADFSISSIISNLSNLLDGNTSRSFLVPVPEDSLRRMSSNPNMDPRAVEALRRLSVAERFPDVSNTMIRVEAEAPNHENSMDSWEEFDKDMEKSFPAWEMENELSTRTKRPKLKPLEEFQFKSAAEAIVEIEKDEREREKFMQHTDFTSFVTPKDSNDQSFNPMSMTNYFLHRSSYPLNPLANSTMMGDGDGKESVAEKPLVQYTPPQREETKAKVKPKVGFQIPQKERLPRTEEQEEEETFTPPVPKLNKYLMSSMCDKKTTDEVSDFVVETCRRYVGRNKDNKEEPKPVTATSVAVVNPDKRLEGSTLSKSKPVAPKLTGLEGSALSKSSKPVAPKVTAVTAVSQSRYVVHNCKRSQDKVHKEVPGPGMRRASIKSTVVTSVSQTKYNADHCIPALEAKTSKIPDEYQPSITPVPTGKPPTPQNSMPIVSTSSVSQSTVVTAVSQGELPTCQNQGGVDVQKMFGVSQGEPPSYPYQNQGGVDVQKMYGFPVAIHIHLPQQQYHPYNPSDPSGNSGFMPMPVNLNVFPQIQFHHPPPQQQQQPHPK